MKKFTLIAIVLLISISAYAQTAGYALRTMYWYYQNVSADIPPLCDIVTLTDRSDGEGTRFKWKVQNPPTKQILNNYVAAVVIDWYADYQAERKADMKDSDKLLKAIVLVFADETGNTPAQIKTKIKAKYKSLQ